MFVMADDWHIKRGMPYKFSDELKTKMAAIRREQASLKEGPEYAAKKAELEELIGFEKPGFELMSMIALGVAADETPAKPPRKPLEDVVTFID